MKRQRRSRASTQLQEEFSARHASTVLAEYRGLTVGADEPAAQGGARGGRPLPRGEEPLARSAPWPTRTNEKVVPLLRGPLALVDRLQRPGRDGQGR